MNPRRRGNKGTKWSWTRPYRRTDAESAGDTRET